MEAVKKLWYKLVASGLVREHKMTVDLLEHTQGLLERQRTITQEHVDRWVNLDFKNAELRKENYRLRRAVEELSCQDPLGRTIVANVDHASKQRVKDLENQIRKLGGTPQ